MSAPLPDTAICERTRRFLPFVTPSRNVTVSPLPGGGSDRQYWRVAFGQSPQAPSAIYMHYTTARPDNLSFIPASHILENAGVAVPRILAHDPESMSIWLEDLGNIHLWDYRHDRWDIRRPLYQFTLDEIARIHRIPEDTLPPEAFQGLQPGFDEALYRWEQNYFFDQFLDRFSRLGEREREAIRRDADLAAIPSRLASQRRRLVHRDFQSQNVLIQDGRPVVIDFQGLRPGRPEYDIASLLFDPYVDLTGDERNALTAYYHQRVPELDAEGRFATNLWDCVTQRLMQAIGAYGFLATQLGKTHFLQHVPSASRTLRELAEQGRAPACLITALAPDAIRLP